MRVAGVGCLSLRAPCAIVSLLDMLTVHVCAACVLLGCDCCHALHLNTWRYPVANQGPNAGMYAIMGSFSHVW